MFNDIARKSVGIRYIANLLVWNASSPSTLLLCSNGFLTARYRSWLMAKVIIIVPNKDICPHGTAQYGTNHAHSVHPNFSWCNPKKKNGALIRNHESKSNKQIMRLLNNLTFLGIFKMVNTPVRFIASPPRATKQMIAAPRTSSVFNLETSVSVPIEKFIFCICWVPLIMYTLQLVFTLIIEMWL